jgi:hypothetical protein
MDYVRAASFYFLSLGASSRRKDLGYVKYGTSHGFVVSFSDFVKNGHCDLGDGS